MKGFLMLLIGGILLYIALTGRGESVAAALRKPLGITPPATQP